MTEDMTKPTFFERALGIETSAASEELWSDWAHVYDTQMEEYGYEGPDRCARALAEFVTDPAAPLIDVGCGTGLSGLALQGAGFTTIDGIDISQPMLDRAGESGAYRSLIRADLAEPLPWEEGTYANAAAVGTMFPGHVPETLFDEVMSRLPSGGCFVFSLTEHARVAGSFEGRLHEHVDTGYAEFLFREDGAHLPGVEVTSTVYVLRRR